MAMKRERDWKCECCLLNYRSVRVFIHRATKGYLWPLDLFLCPHSRVLTAPALRFSR
jgi:hypothetical protein